jgi:hypothetical protein
VFEIKWTDKEALRMVGSVQLFEVYNSLNKLLLLHGCPKHMH